LNTILIDAIKDIYWDHNQHWNIAAERTPLQLQGPNAIDEGISSTCPVKTVNLAVKLDLPKALAQFPR
jgi:hypothetical protein